MKMMATYENLLKQHAAAVKAADKASDRVHELNGLLERERKCITIICQCGKEIRVGDLELIEERTTGSWNCNHQEYDEHIERYYVCPYCTEVFNEQADSAMFPSGFASYVKKVHVWHRGSQRCHGRPMDISL